MEVEFLRRAAAPYAVERIGPPGVQKMPLGTKVTVKERAKEEVREETRETVPHSLRARDACRFYVL